MYTLLLIDDDQDLLQINARNFSDAGYRVCTATSAKAGLELLAKTEPDCVLLDIMMPGLDGFETLRIIRRISAVPVLLLTGRVAEDDKVSGLFMGADDYIEKPYSFRELEARVVAAIRRYRPAMEGFLSFPPLEIDVVNHKAFHNGEDLCLTAREYELLYLLATSDGSTVPFEEIGYRLWGSYRAEDRRSIMVYVSRLRKKMEASPVMANMIETDWSKGYRFTGRRGGGG